ncbi:MAG: thioredoxin domain-containing protein [Deltaproteobacteria bacterium]|nr:thioredoxin domain-containing protein [Deltaproteobacteria bacterium]
MINPSNRLIHEKSPYLLQHAHNPVDWYPWGDEAFERAQAEDKPIFLSIGYSTCHWCHVMERESFEDPEVAGMMNELVISIKVDREERPDLDHVYMTVCQLLTGSGGWPLNIVMTPDKKPYFAGTYIPKETRLGRTGIMDLIPRLVQVWTEQRDEVNDSAEKIVSTLKSVDRDNLEGDLDEAALNMTLQQLAERFDEKHGGFGEAPKFPTPHHFLFLLRHWKRTGDRKALDMVEKTLRDIQKGGIHDHVGFGFHRYATDQTWLVPHFEKMLYDQALLVMAYLEAYQVTGQKIYEETARNVLTYVLRDMTDWKGGFYSAEDADSEGVEGKFYVWSEEEIRKILPPQEADFVIRIFNIERHGNFLDESAGKRTGANILHLQKSLPEIASDMNISEAEIQNRWAAARRRLFSVREKRVHPSKDDKVLTDWNGLMIAAFAKASAALGDPQYAEAAAKAADFVLEHLRKPDGRLMHRYRDGDAAIHGNLDDYAFMIWGLIELYEATFNARHLEAAIELNESMLQHFWDKEAGGLFFSPDDGEALIVRKKEFYDGAVPSGNAVAMWNMLRLGRITANPRLEKYGIDIGRAFSKAVKQFPSAYTQFMVAVDFAAGPSYEVVIVGKPEAKDTKEMLNALARCFTPQVVAIFRPTLHSTEIDSLAGYLTPYQSLNGQATAYVCANFTCKSPTTDVGNMLELIT